MSATTLEFLGWLVATVAVYWMLPKWRDVALASGSLGFLAYYSPQSAAILSAFLLGTHVLVARFQVTGATLLTAVTAMVGVLAYYKLQVPRQPGLLNELLIPLGISYYTFRCIHYLIEQFKGALPSHSFREYAGYQLFLPTLLIGPIHRFGDYQRDSARLRWDPRLFSEGLERLLYGYAKIMVLAVFVVSEQFGGYIDTLPEDSWLQAYLRMIARVLYGYLLFAGYSDVAIGFARLLGFRVAENFNWPLVRKNISEFWQAWHMSLTGWAREYVYMSVVATSRKPWLAALATMLIIGLWHELSLRYVLWGLMHGAAIAVWQVWQALKLRLPAMVGAPKKLVDGLSVVLTFHFVVLTFVVVNEPTLARSFDVYVLLFTGWL